MRSYRDAHPSSRTWARVLAGGGAAGAGVYATDGAWLSAVIALVTVAVLAALVLHLGRDQAGP